MRFHKNKKPRPYPNWTLTFSDVLMNILILFVLLFALSNVDNRKFHTVVDSFNERSSIKKMQEGSGGDGIMPGQEHIKEEEKAELEKLRQQKEKEQHIINTVNDFAIKHNLAGELVANRTQRGIELVLPEKITFRSGDDQLLPEAKIFLEKIAPILNQINNPIMIEGHTDNVPIQTAAFPSNWELSTQRATKVLHYLTDIHHVYAPRFSAIGYGEYRPIASNQTKEGKQKNRRIVLVILNNEPS